MGFHRRQRQGEDRRQGLVGCVAEGQVVGLEMSRGTVRAGGPLEEQEGCPVAATGVGRVVDEGGYRVGQAVRAAERGSALVDPLVAAEGVVVGHLRDRTWRGAAPGPAALR